ncbi:MAG: Unknown protein [uncultured Campylobacterales bacterium]|uniref:Outer membrane protein beta-barrel domain-containing protein n=1 Tax=uncultured Campylobacterales bacterium TaxID=352960 RepID=A0A6S6SMQ8_9BACT|nr:MAG: Unknown protein [uncultured Campylobacterales bacterium]
MLKSFIATIIVSTTLFGNAFSNSLDYVWNDLFAYEKAFFTFNMGENRIEAKESTPSGTVDEQINDGSFFKYSLGAQFYGERIYVSMYDFKSITNGDMNLYSVGFDYIFKPVNSSRYFVGGSIGTHKLKLDNPIADNRNYDFTETKVKLNSLAYGVHVGYEYHELNFGLDLRFEYLFFDGDVTLHYDDVASSLEMDKLYSLMLSFTFKF